MASGMYLKSFIIDDQPILSFFSITMFDWIWLLIIESSVDMLEFNHIVSSDVAANFFAIVQCFAADTCGYH
jgi:hypothetical protein